MAPQSERTHASAGLALYALEMKKGWFAERGIGTMIHYPVPPHLQPAYAHLGMQQGAFPISERMHAEVMSLPIGPTMSLQQADTVIAALRAVL